jgi:DNA-binding NarL/FixJ family response regulator
MRTTPQPSGFEQWKDDLIRLRARRLGFRGHDLDDARQEVALHVWSFRYQKARSNGACESTALTALVDRQLKALLRRRGRYDRHLERLRCEQAAAAGRNGHHERVQLIIDVREAVARLAPIEQAVCHGLASGHSISRIAGDLGRAWHTIRRIIDGIRTHFETLGLNGWLLDG